MIFHLNEMPRQRFFILWTETFEIFLNTYRKVLNEKKGELGFFTGGFSICFRLKCLHIVGPLKTNIDS